MREEADKARQAVEGTLGVTAALQARLGTKANWRSFEDAFDIPLVDEFGKALGRVPPNLDKTGKALSAAAKAAQQFEQQRRTYLRSQYQEISNLSDQADAMERKVELYGLSESALNDLTIAQLKAEQAALQLFDPVRAEEEIAILQRMIDQYERLGLNMRKLEQKEAEKAAWESWSRDVEQIFQQVGQSLTDAIFEGGKSGRDLVKDLFKTLTLRVLINPVMSSIQGAVTNSLGGMFGLQQPQQGGMMGTVSNLGSAYNAASGGLTGNISNVANWVGEKAGSTALQSFASGLSATFGFSAPVAATGGVASLAGVTAGPGLAASLGTGASGVIGGSAAGIGSAIGAALPWVGGALAIGSLLGGSLFGDDEPKTRHGQRSISEWIDGQVRLTATDDRQSAESQMAAAQAAQAAVTQANALFTQLGIDAAFDSFYAIMESSVLGDRQGVASGGMLRIGEELRQVGIAEASDMTIRGFGGWSEAEMLPRLATDVQLTVLEAFQQLGDTLPPVLADMLKDVAIRGLDEAGAQELAQRFTGLIASVNQFQEAVIALPFEQLRGLSFEAAAGLLEAAGGLESLTGRLGTYYESFYSEAERLEITSNNIAKALGEVGLSMPDTRESFRALVEAQDLTTESGQRAYAALLEVSGAFAQVATESERAAEQMAQEMEALHALRRQEYLEAQAEIQRLASAERGDVIAARRAAEQAERDAFDAAVKSYEDGAKAFDELRQTLLSAGDAAGLLAAAVERMYADPNARNLPQWEGAADVFNAAFGRFLATISKGLSDEISANALHTENAGDALDALSPHLGQYGPVVGPLAQALTAAVVEASGDMGYAVRDSVYQAMLGVAQRQTYGQFASQGPGLADIRYAQQQAGWASQVSYTPGFGVQYGADVGAYADALDKLTGRMQSGQITADQFDAAVAKLNETMPTAADLLGDTEAQLQRMADAAREVSMAGARSIDHYFASLRQMAAELEKTEEPINKATAAIGRMNSWVSAFGESAAAAGSFSARTGDASLVAQAAGIAASVLTTADARKAAEALANDVAFAGLGGADLRDMALLVDGIRAFDPASWETAFIRISDALGTGAITQDQYAALFNYSLDVFEDTARTTQQLEQSFDRLRDAAKSLADELLLDRDLTTLSFGQQYSEAQRQYEDVMRRAMGGDADAAGDLDRVTRGFLERSADSRDEIQYRRDFAVAVNSLRQIEQSNPVVDEIKRLNSKIEGLNSEVEGLRADLREANAQLASNTNDTTRLLRKIDAMGLKVTA